MARLTKLADDLRPLLMQNGLEPGITFAPNTDAAVTTIIDDTTTANNYTYPNDGSVPADVTIAKYSLTTDSIAFLLYSCKNGIWFGEKAGGASSFTYKGFHNSINGVQLGWSTVTDQDATDIDASTASDTLTLAQTLMIGTVDNHIQTGQIGISCIQSAAGGTGAWDTEHLQVIIACDGSSTVPGRGVVMAGTALTASSRSACVGGHTNSATGSRSAAIAGTGNAITGADSAAVGGNNCDISGLRSATVGGLNVEITDNTSAAIACRNMSIAGELSAGVCLDDGYVDGDQAFGFGRRVKIESGDDGCMILADATVTDISPSTTNEATLCFQNGFRFFTNSDRDAGALLAGSATSWTSTSSRRIKQNIEPVNYKDVLSRFDRFDVNTYQFIDGDGRTYAGPIAEEWQTAFTGVFDPHFTGKLPAINSGNQAAMALAGVKALREENKLLRETVDDLLARVEALEAA